VAPVEVRALVEQGYLRVVDVAPILGMTMQRVSQQASCNACKSLERRVIDQEALNRL
jgi:hypothetical protein